MSITSILIILWLFILYATDANRDAKMSRFAGPTIEEWWKRHYAKWYNQGAAVLPAIYLLYVSMWKSYIEWYNIVLIIAVTIVCCFIIWRISARYWGGVKWGSFVLKLLHIQK